jgi:hypothetical protein
MRMAYEIPTNGYTPSTHDHMGIPYSQIKKNNEHMKILLDIPDSKAAFFMELLKNFSFVKAQPLSAYKAKVLGDVKEAVEEMKLIKAGKLQARNAEELFNEL